MSPKSDLGNQPEYLNSQKTYKSHELDKLSTIDILKVFNSEDYTVSSAVSGFSKILIPFSRFKFSASETIP